MSTGDGLRGDSVHGRLFWAVGGLGWAVMAIGAWGIVVKARATRPPELSAWVIGAAVVHDLVMAPVVLSVGRMLARATQGLPRAAIQVGLILTGVLVVYSIPVLGGFGRLGDNPSLLPREYGVSVIALLAATWGAALAAALWGWRRRAGRIEGRPPDRR